MALCTAAECREMALMPSGVSDKVDGALTNWYIPSAGARLTRWVGAAAYVDAGLETPANAARAASLKRAELCLALCGLYNPALNTNLDKGKMLSSVSGADGGTTAFIGPQQLQKMSEAWLRQAEMEAGDYITLETNLSPQISYAYDADGEAIDED